MSNLDIIRAWKDPKYRAQLSEAERAQLPDSPVGRIELPSEQWTQMSLPSTTRAGPTCRTGACCIR
jgi:mersacidin/lichenicidin family type 2 lantibiotic